MNRTRGHGFTLVELMIVVAVIGLLSAIAIPAFRVYVRRSKVTEAYFNIHKIYDSTVAYIEAEHAASDGAILPKMFPMGVSWTPAHGVCCSQTGFKCNPTTVKWTDPTWEAVNFGIDDPFYYSYQTVNENGDGTKVGDLYNIEASGDLNCDGVYSLFRRSIKVGDGIVIGGSGMYAQHEPD